MAHYNSRKVQRWQQALEHNLSYQDSIQSNIDKLKEILHQNSEKQRVLKTKISRYNVHKLMTEQRGPKRVDFFVHPHWTFNTMDKETGVITPTPHNKDIQMYKKKHPNFRIDHTHIKFSLCEQRALAKAISNTIRLLYLEDLHKKYKNKTMSLEEELNKIRIKDSKNQLWPLQHWKKYPISWQRIAKQHMSGRSAIECEIFWKSANCTDNPTINRKKTWNKQESNALIEIVQKYQEKDWISIAQQHNHNRTALQCAQQWMRKLKPRAKVDRKWTQEEDDLLSQMVFKHSKHNFVYTASYFKNRTALQCSSRWLKSTAPYLRSGEWDTMEDIQCVLSHNAYLPKHPPIINDRTFETLETELKISQIEEKETCEVKEGKNGKKVKRKTRKVVKKKSQRTAKHGVWVLIGRHVTNRNDVKARERYMNVLNPDIDIHTRWTQKEDEDLLKYHEQYGDKWSLIARELGTNRTDCYCRQRVKALKNKTKRKKRKRRDIEEKQETIEPMTKKQKQLTRNTNNATLRRRQMTTRSKAKGLYNGEAPQILNLPETHEFAEQIITKQAAKQVNERRNKRQSEENIPFIGRKPNKLKVNARINSSNRYIVPRKISGEGANDGCNILSLDNNAIDRFIENEKNRVHPPIMNNIAPFATMPTFHTIPTLSAFDKRSINENRLKINLPVVNLACVAQQTNGNNTNNMIAKLPNLPPLPPLAPISELNEVFNFRNGLKKNRNSQESSK